MLIIFLVLAVLRFSYSQEGETINACDSSPCVNGQCMPDISDNFRCGCNPGFTGRLCNEDISECISNPCQNEGLCANGENEFHCICLPGSFGTTCEVLVSNICATFPCLNGATCENVIQGGFICTCVTGFTGSLCERNVDDCSPNPCQNDGVCRDGLNEFECQCAPGYTGQICDVECPCQNGGLCIKDINMQMHCLCPGGFFGIQCEFHTSNSCATIPCLNGATCENAFQGGFFCTCNEGFTGSLCETNIDDCSPIPCQNGGHCVDGNNAFLCACHSGYVGVLCEIDAENCEESKQCCASNGNEYRIAPVTDCTQFIQSVSFGKITFSYLKSCPKNTIFDTENCLCNHKGHTVCHNP